MHTHVCTHGYVHTITQHPRRTGVLLRQIETITMQRTDAISAFCHVPATLVQGVWHEILMHHSQNHYGDTTQHKNQRRRYRACLAATHLEFSHLQALAKIVKSAI